MSYSCGSMFREAPAFTPIRYNGSAHISSETHSGFTGSRGVAKHQPSDSMRSHALCSAFLMQCWDAIRLSSRSATRLSILTSHGSKSVMVLPPRPHSVEHVLHPPIVLVADAPNHARTAWVRDLQQDPALRREVLGRPPPLGEHPHVGRGPLHLHRQVLDGHTVLCDVAEHAPDLGEGQRPHCRLPVGHVGVMIAQVVEQPVDPLVHLVLLELERDVVEHRSSPSVR